ncbi:MAG: hypothetical protein ACFFDF_07505 [Candidatus Odinarchaeota archaeon]
MRKRRYLLKLFPRKQTKTKNYRFKDLIWLVLSTDTKFIKGYLKRDELCRIPLGLSLIFISESF